MKVNLAAFSAFSRNLDTTLLVLSKLLYLYSSIAVNTNSSANDTMGVYEYKDWIDKFGSTWYLLPFIENDPSFSMTLFKVEGTLYVCYYL